ncbi:MAG: PIN domain-containing protein [Tepidiformaceae bacterium]
MPATDRPLAVVDTNVVVAAVKTHDNASPTARVLRAMVTEEPRFLLSVDVLAEYRTVLLRPRIARGHGLGIAGVDLLIERLVSHGDNITPGPSPPDPMTHTFGSWRWRSRARCSSPAIGACARLLPASWKR